MTHYRLLVVTAFTVATVPRLAQRGMFVDGVTYATIARNLAAAHGSFWEPFYTATIYPRFHEHPPLGFWLQSLWFRVLGDHWYVERLYSVAVAFSTAALIALVWRRLNAASAAQRFEWLPVLLWTAVPVVSWAIVGNLLETTVSLFTTAALTAVVWGGLGGGELAAVVGGVIAGLSVVAATLIKGPVGLFPLAAPLLLVPITPSKRQAWIGLMAQWATFLVCLGVVLSADAARSSLSQYIDQQVVQALGGRREVSGSSVTILTALFQGVILPLTLAAGLIGAVARRVIAPTIAQRNAAIAFSLIGLSGTLPILASPKQAGYYLVPAVPLYAMAVAMALVPTAMAATERIAALGQTRIVGAVASVLAVAAVVMALTPTLDRDRRRLADLDAVASMLPRGGVIGICPEVNADWGLHAWVARRFAASLDAAHGEEREWFLQSDGAPRRCVPAGCLPTTDSTRALVLLHCGR